MGSATQNQQRPTSAWFLVARYRIGGRVTIEMLVLGPMNQQPMPSGRAVAAVRSGCSHQTDHGADEDRRRHRHHDQEGAPPAVRLGSAPSRRATYAFAVPVRQYPCK